MRQSFAERRQWFRNYVQRIEQGVDKPPRLGVRYPCPCCGYPTLEIQTRGYEICDLCGWEDDGQADPGADEVWGGPNSDLSLSQARSNFEKYFVMYTPVPLGAGRLRDEKSPVQEAAKLAMCAAFDLMIEETAPTTIDVLWERVSVCERILQEETSRIIREYEAKMENRQRAEQSEHMKPRWKTGNAATVRRGQSV